MSQLEIAVSRPKRWDEPFGEMTERDVDALLRVEPFRSIDAGAFPPSLPLRGILAGDTRTNRYEAGDLVVREGDYGHSAFLVLSGAVRVVLERLRPEVLGRDTPLRRGWMQAIAQLWQNSRLPEVRRAVGPTVGQAQPDNTDASRPVGQAQPDNTDASPPVGQAQPDNTDASRPVGQAQPDNTDASRPEKPDARVFLQDVPRLLEQTGTVQLGVGEFFGELAALTRTPRTATVFADGPAVLLEIRWQGLRDLMRRSPAIRAHLEQLYRENSLRVHLRETPLLADLPAESMEQVVAATVFESYGNFDWHSDFRSHRQLEPAEQLAAEPLIAEEGDRPTGLILIRSGFARVSRRHGHGQQTIAYLGKGQAFGLEELVESHNTGAEVTWRHSLRAVGYVDVLRIPVDVVVETILPNCKLQIMDSSNHSAIHNSRAEIDPRLLDFLADHRFLNGTQTMMINLDRCTRCDDCVRACAATHDNNPRFVRQGSKHDQFMIANACMHCVDPVCMIGCPTGAIGRDADTGTVRINDRTCIGCSTCANSCPYSAIRMVEIREPGGAFFVDQATQQPILKATKCDFCAGQLTGPACQAACPHDALVRVDMGNLATLSEWVGR